MPQFTVARHQHLQLPNYYWPRQVAVKAGLDDDVGFDWIHLIKRRGELQYQATTEARDVRF